MIDNAALYTILQSATDLSTVVEIYASDAVPGDSGFNPADAIGLYAAVSGITFQDEPYTRRVTRINTIKRTIGKESNTATVTFSNTDASRTISRFELNTGFEGKIMVIRLISRTLSTTLAKSMILFTGRCEKPQSGDKKSLSVSATWILGGVEVQVPRRKYTVDDQEGRVRTDPAFEGFVFMPQYGTTTFTRRERRHGILGFFGFKKTVKYTISYSSYSDIDVNKAVPEVFGKTQLLATHLEAADVGTDIKMNVAFAEGEIYGYESVRSTDSRLPLDGGAYSEQTGKIGALNDPDPTWLSGEEYSKTAYIRCKADNSPVDEVEPAPDVAAIVVGRIMTIPDGSGDWVLDDEWSDNAAAHTRFLLTSDDYFKLVDDWIDDPSFSNCYAYNDELIIKKGSSDFTFLVAG